MSEFDLTQLKTKFRNPRKISDADFERLKKSVEQFPKMLPLRPIVYDPQTMEVLGGNQRLKALQQLGYKSIPSTWVKSAEDLTEDEKKRFVVQDNIEAGDWDFEILTEDWDTNTLNDWGVDIPVFLEEPDHDELIGEMKNKPPVMKLTFKSPEQLQEAENDIQELIDRKFPGAYYSVSAGEGLG